MSQRYVTADRNQTSLLPYDLREWVPEDDLVHFVIEAVEGIALEKFETNVRGSGSAQYHPHMMLALLIYCYANGIFGSRRIERATHRDIAVRYVCANTHPDHDTICKFRRENFAAVAEAFLQVLKLAREMNLLRVGTVSIDGTKLKANAGKDKSVCYERAGQLEQQLKVDIAALMKQAEEADVSENADPQKLPDEIARREKLLEKMQKARTELERRANERAAAQRKEHEEKMAAQKQPDESGNAEKPQPAAAVASPRDKEQANLTDADSRLMRKNSRSEYIQGYNAQAVVDAEGTQLIVGVRVSQCASDRNELAADVAAIPQQIGKPSVALADNGYACEDMVAQVQKDGTTEALVSVGAESKHQARTYDFRPQLEAKAQPPEPRPNEKPWIGRMRDTLQTERGRALYRLRKQTVEPVFGIIKQAMGFRQFLLRGFEKVDGEWLLVATAYNFRRLFALAEG
jgi:transposase